MIQRLNGKWSRIPARAALVATIALLCAGLWRVDAGTAQGKAERKSDMYIQFVKFNSALSEAEVRRIMEERAPQFRAIEGLVQKYYVREPATGAWAGIYIWDSEASMRAFLDSDLRRSIPGAYRAVEPPRVELMEVLFPLRDEAAAHAAKLRE